MENKDRWSALSMKERAEVINMCVRGGLLSPKDIREFYNSFDGGGYTETQLQQATNNANEYFKKWYQNPERKKRGLTASYNKSVDEYRPTIDDNIGYIVRDGDNLFYDRYISEDTSDVNRTPILRHVKAPTNYKYTGEYIEVPGSNGIKVSNPFYNDLFLPEAKARLQEFTSDDNLTKLSAKFAELPSNVSGQYSPTYGDTVYVKKNSSMPIQDIVTHEGSHRISNTFDKDGAMYLMPDTPNLTTYKSTHLYYDNPDEILARLNNIRHVAGINPDKIMTKEDINNIRNAYYNGKLNTSNINIFELLDRYDTESLLKLFNNSFGDGGDTKATLTGKVRFNPFKAFNRNYRGTNIYESDNFGDAFRQARIDGEDMFVWNDKVYSTELAPNPLVEAAKSWNTQGDLAKEDFRMSIIRNPQVVLDYYNSTYPKGKYTTANRRINEYDIPYMYSLGTKGMEDLVMNKYANQAVGDAIWKELANSKLSYEQKIAILANSYHETNGWTALRQYGNGPASGIYMMEKPQREVYKAWLADNNLKDSYANQTKFVVSLFDNKDSSLRTAWDRAVNKQEEIKSYKDSNEAESKGYRAAYNHQDYTTQQAFKDWNSSNLDATTTAFEGLFERAGVPALENRMRIAHLLSKKYK